MNPDALRERLGHLRTDRRGLPVPYINQWGPHEPDGALFSIRPDPNIGGVDALFYDDSGFDVPDFTRQNMQRQRECVSNGLCQVCGDPLAWAERFLVIAGGISTETIDLHGERVQVIKEPWLCGYCVEAAVTTCPALIRRKRSDDLHVVPIIDPRQVTLIGSKGWIEGPLEAESRRIQPYMWAKIAVHGLTVIERKRRTHA